MKPRVKITNKGQVLVTVPYKHGEVTWALDWKDTKTYGWLLFEKQAMYNPESVTKFHAGILSGKKLRLQILKKAAASHDYVTLKKIAQTYEAR